MQLFLKILSGMANSVDPDQKKSDLDLHYLHMPFCQKSSKTYGTDKICS